MVAAPPGVTKPASTAAAVLQHCRRQEVHHETHRDDPGYRVGGPGLLSLGRVRRSTGGYDAAIAEANQGCCAGFLRDVVVSCEHQELQSPARPRERECL